MPIGFTQVGGFSGVIGLGSVINNPTSLQFGPDGKLYVAEQDGTINVFTIAIQDGEYIAVDHEVLELPNGLGVVQGIQNHNDDGSLVSGQQPGGNTNNRQVTGIIVTGTEEEPVLYITSSDPRISANGEVGLDTNSGILTKVTYDSTTGEWDAVDLIRGLPRSEENHATNGMQLSADGSTLYMQVGGNTNNGAPSTFFSNTIEYTLSGTLLAIDLVALEQMPIKIDADG